MTLDLWMGIAIGMFAFFVILLAFMVIDGKRLKGQRRNLDEANHLLRQRNNIGIRQCVALEAIAEVILAGGDEFGITEHEEGEATP